MKKLVSFKEMGGMDKYIKVGTVLNKNFLLKCGDWFYREIQILEKELSEKTEALKLFQTSENKKDNTADIDYNDFYGFDNISVDDRIE